MEITVLVVTALVVGLTQLVKPFISDSRFIPVVAVLFGIIMTVLAGDMIDVIGIKAQIITGLVLGLSGVGLYSTGSNLSQKVE